MKTWISSVLEQVYHNKILVNLPVGLCGFALTANNDSNENLIPNIVLSNSNLSSGLINCMK